MPRARNACADEPTGSTGGAGYGTVDGAVVVVAVVFDPVDVVGVLVFDPVDAELLGVAPAALPAEVANQKPDSTARPITSG